MYLQRILILIVGVNFSEAYRCPGPEWMPRRNTKLCYYIQNPIANNDWERARQECLVRGGNLATVTDKSDMDYIESRMTSFVSNKYWVGLSYESGEWKWADTDTAFVNGSITGFYPDSLFESYHPNDENRRRYRGYLAWSASQANRPLCKTEEGWDYSDGTCWKLQPVRANYTRAMQICDEQGGFIGVPSNLNQTTRLLRFVEGDSEKDAWIGLTFTKEEGNMTTDELQWADNTEFEHSFNRSMWNANDLDTALTKTPTGVQKCAAVRKAYFGPDFFGFIDCVRGLKFGCETHLELCPYGWDRHGDFCYQLHSGGSTVKSWSEAQTFCGQQGGYLANIDSLSTQNFLQARIHAAGDFDGRKPPYWIGFRSIGNGQPFYWYPNVTVAVQNGPYVQGSFGNSQDELCGTTNGEGKWSTAICRTWNRFVCQADPSFALTEDIVHQDIDCLPPFVKYHEGCYHFVSKPMNWDMAKEFCADEQSQLVRIHSAGENNFIKDKLMSTILNNTWIGIRLAYTELKVRFLQFADGSNYTSTDFYNFESAPPSSLAFAVDDELCYYMQGPVAVGIPFYQRYDPGEWVRAKCTDEKPFVCYHRGTLLPPVEPSDLNPPECGPGWVLNGTHCYKVVVDPVVHTQAWQTCMNQGPDSNLLYITSEHEAAFIKELVNGRTILSTTQLSEASAYWTAMKGQNNYNNGFSWYWSYRYSTDTHHIPLAYSDWSEKGEPRPSGPSIFCAMVLADESAQWEAENCLRLLPFICKKPAVIRDASTTAPPVVPPIATNLGCPFGWVQVLDHCYLTNETLLSWHEANESCTSRGYHLLSIHNAAQHLARNVSGHWLGLNSIENPADPRIYRNSDGTHVRYTPWIAPQVARKSADGDNNCVYPSIKSFHNSSCDIKRPFICMAPLQVMEQINDNCVQPPHDLGCQKWGYGRQGSCYYMGNQPNTPFGTREFRNFEDSRRFCRNHYGADLISISDKDEEDYLTLLLGTWAADYWIGLRENSDAGNLFKTWVSGEPVTTTNWAFNEPRSDFARTGCVAIHGTVNELLLPGDWYVTHCDRLKFAICEGPRADFTTPIPVTGQMQKGCPRGWGTPDAEYSRNCYKVFEPETENTRLTWRQSENHCAEFGGHLASITTQGEQNYVMGLTPKTNESDIHEFWIGLHEQPNSGAGSTIPKWVWTDDSPYGTTGFDHPAVSHSSYDSSVYHCVLMDNSDWVGKSCQVTAGWICEIPQGKYAEGAEVTVVPTMSPAFMTNATCSRGESVEGEWFYDAVTDNCFFLSSERQSWDESQTTCRNMSSNLATIDEKENTFITTVLSHKVRPADHTWIGLRLENFLSRKHNWVDGSTSSYREWDSGQPNAISLEACVTINSRNGKWVDEYCSRAFRFLCQVEKTPTPTKAPPSEGGCPENMAQFGNHCYYFSKQNENATWEDARGICRSMYPDGKSNLLSVHSELENNFVVSNLHGNWIHRWTGLHEEPSRKDFFWADNTAFDFNKWNWHEPIAPKTACVMMYGDRARAGRWDDEDCAKMNGYVCKSNKNPKLPTAAVNSGKCEAGLMEYGGHCYGVFPIESGFKYDSAKSTCSSKKLDVATITNVFENAFVHTLIDMATSQNSGKDPRSWLGLREREGALAWESGCPVTFSHVIDLYSTPPENACVVFNPTNGKWEAIACDHEHYYVVCEGRGEPCPTRPEDASDYCPEGFAAKCGRLCHRIEQSTPSVHGPHVTWSEAKKQCEVLGGHLVSIRDRNHSDCLTNFIDHSSENLWIGLQEAYDVTDGNFYWRWVHQGGFDSSLNNWEQGKPSTGLTGAERETCAAIQSNGKWVNLKCEAESSKRGFICETGKLLQRPPTTRNPLQPTKAPVLFHPIPHSLTGGALAGIAIGVVLGVTAMVFGAFVFWKRRGSPTSPFVSIANFKKSPKTDQEPVLGIDGDDATYT